MVYAPASRSAASQTARRSGDTFAAPWPRSKMSTSGRILPSATRPSHSALPMQSISPWSSAKAACRRGDGTFHSSLRRDPGLLLGRGVRGRRRARRRALGSERR